MDPKELAAYLKKKQDEAANKGDATARWEKGQREESQKRTKKGKSALKNSVIPYLQRVQAAMPQGQFGLSPSGDGVTLLVHGGSSYSIEVPFDNVLIRRIHPDPRKTENLNDKLGVRDISDLTEAKLGELVKMAIDELFA
jgi:hypothetical protein